MRRLTHGQIFSIRRTFDCEDVGLVTETNSNIIADVKNDSFMQRAGLTKRTQSFLEPGKEVRWAVTEVNGRLVSSKNNDLEPKLHCVGRELSVL